MHLHKFTKDKHARPLPTARGIRRACSKELYRTRKRMNLWVPHEKIEEAEKLYYRKVIGNLLWIHENGSNRKVLADWFEQEVAGDIAAIWDVDATALAQAFRDAFGG